MPGTRKLFHQNFLSLGERIAEKGGVGSSSLSDYCSTLEKFFGRRLTASQKFTYTHSKASTLNKR